MTTKKTVDRIEALETRLDVNKQRIIGWCGHELCRWKLPADLHNCLVVATGVPREDCTDPGNRYGKS